VCGSEVLTLAQDSTYSRSYVIAPNDEAFQLNSRDFFVTSDPYCPPITYSLYNTNLVRGNLDDEENDLTYLTNNERTLNLYPMKSGTWNSVLEATTITNKQATKSLNYVVSCGPNSVPIAVEENDILKAIKNQNPEFETIIN